MEFYFGCGVKLVILTVLIQFIEFFIFYFMIHLNSHSFFNQVVPNSLWSHGLQHIRLPWLSLSPGVCAKWCPLSRWCYLSIPSSASASSFCLLSFPASRSFPVSWLFESDSQSIIASVSVIPVNIQGWFSLGLTGLISLQSKGFSRLTSSTMVWKHQFFGDHPSLWSNSHIRPWLLEKP